MPKQHRDHVGPVQAYALAESFPTYKVERYVPGEGIKLVDIMSTARFSAELTRVNAGSLAISQIVPRIDLSTSAWKPHSNGSGRLSFYSPETNAAQDLREHVVESLEEPGHVIVIGGYLRRVREKQHQQSARFQLMPYAWDLLS